MKSLKKVGKWFNKNQQDATKWVVTMHRTTKSEHSYVVGVYDDLKDAKKAAIIEEYNRAGKYDAAISGYVLNELPEEIIDDEI